MTAPTENLTWEQLIEKGLIEKYGDEYYFTDKMAETIRNGEKWADYYKGEHTIIRKDKLALLNKNTATLRKLVTPTQSNHVEATHCQYCGGKLRTMPCDEELTYCPTCDIPSQHQ